ncbi:hypothetical protein DNTS_028311 [Danionella cerebrum]|uniref:Tbk1/Ikki binding domain-containing protein n=1 Tax=Danionella cerebrum TaxID=2873325 RepID=A0A553NL86_9TELE|nr:hypothetical protein DNTS_028311 [Danionella translucida]
MERTISEQLNKAFEAYRRASIEKEAATNQLQQKVGKIIRKELKIEHTEQLERQIEEQKKTILSLKAELSSLRNHSTGEVCEATYRKQEAEALSSSDHRTEIKPSTSHRTNHFLGALEHNAFASSARFESLAQRIEFSPLKEANLVELMALIQDLQKGHMGLLEINEPKEYPGNFPHALSAACEMKRYVNHFREIQGTFQRIQTLTRKQKDHLKRIHKGSESSNEQFSMPIQCTDGPAERAEISFSSTARPEVDETPASASLASRGADPGDCFFDSLRALSVKFPPNTEDEYEFLNSAPEKRLDLSLHHMSEEGFPSFSTSGTPPHSPATSGRGESVRGPQQLFWTPELQASAPDPQQMNSPEKCAFCEDHVPANHMYSHLNSHFKNKAGH